MSTPLIAEIKQLMDDECNSLCEINGRWVEITTTLLDRHNDALQIYARRDNCGLLLTDDGYTIADLEASGFSFTPQHRQNLLQKTLDRFGVQLNDGALETHTDLENFPVRKHNLILAMRALDDMRTLWAAL